MKTKVGLFFITLVIVCFWEECSLKEVSVLSIAHVSDHAKSKGGGKINPQQAETLSLKYQINPIDLIKISDNPPSLVIRSIPAGSNLASAIYSSTSYSITTNGINRSIRASLDQDLPSGMSLKVCLAPPQGASTQGFVTLTRYPQILVNNVSKVAASGLNIVYLLEAGVQAGKQRGNFNVTYTIGP